MRERATSSTIELSRCEAVESHTSTQVPFAPLCRACIVGRGREAPQPFHLGRDEAVTVTTLVASLDNFSLTLTDNTTGEDNTPTTVHTTYDQILTECVRAHSAMGEFFNKSPDRKNVTFEATDGGLDRSHESLAATFNTKDTVDNCAMHCGDWNWLQRHTYSVQGLVPHSVHVFLQELSYLRMIFKSDGVTLITALETTVQEKRTADNQDFQTQLIL